MNGCRFVQLLGGHNVAVDVPEALDAIRFRDVVTMTCKSLGSFLTLLGKVKTNC